MDLPKRPFTNNGSGQSIVHFIETAPSVLREVPWITIRECKVSACTCIEYMYCMMYDVLCVHVHVLVIR